MHTMTSDESPHWPRGPGVTGIIYSIGGAGLSFVDLARLADRYGITVLVDIRAAADVPNEGDLSRKELGVISAEAGYGYRWLGDRLDATRSTAAVVDEVAGLALSGTVVLLCSAEDPLHRDRAGALAPHLTERGLQLMHVGTDGVAEPHQDHLGL